MFSNIKKLKTFTLIIILSLALSGCTHKKEISEPEQTAKPQVSVITATPAKTIETQIKLSGTAKPINQVSLISLASGRVLSKLAQIGENVYIGEPIFLLYDQTIENNYSTTLTNLDNAERTLANTRLSVLETVSQAELTVQQAEQALELAQQNLIYQEQLTDNSLQTSLNNLLNSQDTVMDVLTVAMITMDDIYNEKLDNTNFGAINPQAKFDFQINYKNAQKEFNDLDSLNLSLTETENNTEPLLDTLNLFQITLDYFLTAIDGTPLNNNFTQSIKDTLIANVHSQQTSVATAKSSLQTNSQSLISTKINNQSTLNTYQNQIATSEIALQNALSSVTNAGQNTDSQVSSAENAVQRAQSEVNLAQIQKNRLTITAPLSGTVSQLNVEIGDEINPGMNLGQISQVKALEIEAEVTPEIASAIKVGQAVDIENYGQASITEISPTPDPATGKVKIKIAWPTADNNVISDSFISLNLPVSLPTSQENVFVLPLKAVFLSTDSAKVKIVENGRIKTINISVGKTVGNIIEITSGLTEGQQIIIGGADFINEETEVEIISQ